MARPKNAINPATGKRFRSDERDSTWELNRERNEYYIPGSVYDPGNPGYASVIGDGSSGTSTGSDTEEAERVLFETVEDRIIVEKGTGEPKQTKTRSTRGPGKAKGAITPQHVESWVSMGFAFIAMTRNNSLWAIHDPDTELKPWTPSAAELLNKISGDHAEKITEASAATMVVWGLASLVIQRANMERQQRLEQARANAEQMKFEEFAEYEPVSQPVTYTPNGTNPSGARPVSPDESIFGNGV